MVSKYFRKPANWFLLFAGVALIILAIKLPFVEAAEFPSKTVSIICPWSPGGAADSVSRFLASIAGEYLKQPVVVVNKVGGTGAVGHSAGATAAPDGHTVTMMTVESVTISKLGVAKVSYTDFKPIMRITFWGAGVQVRADAPWKNIDELVADAKKNPGKFRVATIGPGGIWTLAAQGLQRQMGITLKEVPFDGAGPGIVALLGGHVDIATGGLAEAWSHIQAGKLKTIGLMSGNRSAFFPNVPTLKEQGIDLVIGAWLGLGVPQKTAEDRVQVLHEAFKKSIDSDAFKELMKKATLDIVYMGPNDFGSELKKEDVFYGGLIKPVK